MEGFAYAGARAGFWRRLVALLIDGIVVLIPLQVLVAVLFAQTNGGVQGTFGMKYTVCSPVTQLPDGLQPAPPEGYNAATECVTSFLGFATAHSLTVSKITQDGNVTSSVSRSYWLGADGLPRDQAFQTDWIAIILLFVYLATMEFRSGATVGKRILGIRVVDVTASDTIGIPLKKAILRQMAMVLGALPMIGILMASLSLSPEDAENANISAWLLWSAVAGVINLGWLVWIIVSVSGKRDPIYDKLVGTAVLRT